MGRDTLSSLEYAELINLDLRRRADVGMSSEERDRFWFLWKKRLRRGAIND